MGLRFSIFEDPGVEFGELLGEADVGVGKEFVETGISAELVVEAEGVVVWRWR